ncbi:Sodium channel protein type 7 subunit alpha [Camelus dromedarius]|uniref:Sodium channel protein n=1 Tax=Camelus dromedarius TaxID=9838 RepID=A0A5N4E7F1_CAMDR|nr:Sodium channel protein type 7 subunit alpha [Camelus dromedarius]
MCQDGGQHYIDYGRNTLLGIYTFEILIKLIARGIWAGPFYFFGDPWNWLDFSVTLFEHIARYSPLNSISIFRITRNLRILKMIPLNQGKKGFECLKSFVGILIQCLKKLTGVIILTLFFLSIFSLIGMGLFMGNLKHKCLRWPRENETETLHNRTGNPYYIRETENFYYLEGERYALLCGNRTDAGQCPEGYVCVKAGVNPDYGYTNFDSFGWALLALFRLMMQDYPEALYHQILYASGKVYMIFFVVISFWFAFYMASLFLGILAMSYEEEKQTAAEKAKKYEPELQQSLTELQEGKKAEETKTTQIEMKKRSSTSMITSLDMLDDATIRCKEETNNVLSIGNLVFIGIFTTEMIFKIIAMHPYGYFQVGWNIYDSLIVFHGLAEFYVTSFHGLAVFRSFRVLRIFKLGKYWPTFSILMLTLSNSLVALKDLVLLLFTFTFFSAVVGLKLFGSNYKECVCNIDEGCQLPRWHMHDFFHSFLNVFRILCGEWIETLWDCFKVASQFSCIPFYMMVILIGNLLILYLFLALVSSFSSYKAATMEENNEAKNLQHAIARIKKGINYVLSKILCKKQNVLEETMDNISDIYIKENISDHTLSELSNTQDFLKDKEKSNGTKKNTVTENESQSLIPSPSVSETVPIASEESDIENPDNKEIQSKSGDGSSKEKVKQSSSSECSTVDIAISEEEEMVYEHEKPKHLKNGYGRRSSSAQISRESKKGKIWQNIRKTCCKIVENNCFKGFIGLVTLLSMGALAFEDIYIDQRKTIKILLEYADMIFTYIFILEMLLKWMAYGLKAYFTNGWYKLDFLVVIVFCLSLIGKSREELKPLMSIKFLRALRVLSQFERMKATFNGWITIMNSAVDSSGNKFQGFIFDLVTHQGFNVIIMVLTCFQAITIMIQSDEQSPKMDVALYWSHSVFVMLYTGECVLKLIAFHCNYFTSAWNIFDFMVVVFSITGLFLPLMVGYYLVPPSLVQLILLSRIIHILRPEKGPKVFHDLLLPLMLCLPAVLNISLLIFLIMFVYAIFGMYNFAYVKKEAGINDVSNFETFGSSMLCLFQVTIFAGWDGMLNAIFNSQGSDCDPDKINPGTQVRGDCGNPFVGVIYFVSYILISWLIIVNLYIVVVMEFLNMASKKKAKTLSEDDFRKFFQVWKRFDPDRTQYIDSSKLSDFAAALDPPLFMAKPNKGQLVAMDLPMAVGDRIHCLDILLALTKRVVGKDVKMEKVLSEIESGFMLANPFKITYEPITTTLKRKQEAVSATIIQRAYKSYRLRQNDKNTSDSHMIDGDSEVQAAKEDSHFDKVEGKSTIQSQL